MPEIPSFIYNNSMSKKSESRQQKIYEQLLMKETVRVNELSEQYHVSMETIRKDLNEMENQGLLVKTHGGAEILEKSSEVSIDYKINTNSAAKQEIAHKALSLIEDHSVIFLDPGSTTLALARLLPLKKDLIVVTNSIKIASMICEQKHELIFLGGKIQKKAKAAAGYFAINHLDTLHIDTAFMGTDGFKDSTGPTTYSFEEVSVKQHALLHSDHKYLLADSSKFDSQGTYRFASFKDFDALITDQKQSDMVIDCKVIQA